MKSRSCNRCNRQGRSSLIEPCWLQCWVKAKTNWFIMIQQGCLVGRDSNMCNPLRILTPQQIWLALCSHTCYRYNHLALWAKDSWLEVSVGSVKLIVWGICTMEAVPPWVERILRDTCNWKVYLYPINQLINQTLKRGQAWALILYWVQEWNQANKILVLKCSSRS